MTQPDRPALSGPAGPSPPRRPGSIRRTLTLEALFPDGPGTPMHVRGRARDLLTPAGVGAPRVLSQATLGALVDPDRTIRRLTTQPPRPALEALVGSRGGGNLRGRIAEAVPLDRARGTALHLLLDDLPILSLISWYAFSPWLPPAQLLDAAPAVLRAGMSGVCYGLREGSRALDEAGFPRPSEQVRPVRPLAGGSDEWAWHDIDPDPEGVSMRRARRIDVTAGDGGVHVDATFQDSMTCPDGRRRAVHEYLLTATAGHPGGVLTQLAADPRILPYLECPAAAMGIQDLLGTPLLELRREVLHRLGGARGCTHLNDAVRALADVPALAERLMSAAEESHPET